MKRQILFGAVIFAAVSVLAAPQDEVKSAAKKLSDAANYSWRSTSEMGGGGGGGRFRPGPTDGKTVKDGTIHLTMARGETSMEVVLKGEKGAMKTEEGWQSFAEAEDGGGGQQNRGRFWVRMLRNFKAPAAQVEELVGQVKELKLADGAYAGDLTEEGAKSQLSFGGRAGGQGPSISNAKGSVKFWVKDGQLTKYECTVKGTMSFGDNERDIDRTTTVEIKDVGTTKLEVPAEATKKMS